MNRTRLEMTQRMSDREFKITVINLLKKFSSEKGCNIREKMGEFQNKEGEQKSNWNEIQYQK